MATKATADEPQADGNGEKRQAEPVPPDDYQAALRRAEELVDRAAEQIGPYASQAKRQLRTLAARAREEAEDIWAEAQDIRERNRPR